MGSLLTENVVEMLMKENDTMDFVLETCPIDSITCGKFHPHSKLLMLMSTFMTAGYVVTLPHNCFVSIAFLSTMCWLWISTLSCSCLYATDCLSTDTPLTPFAPATINLQINV